MFLSFLPVLAQERNVEIVGEIIDSETKGPIPYVHILNTKDQKGTIGNTRGRFWITIQEGDSLLLSAIGFNKYVFTLKDNVETGQLLLTVELNKSAMELRQ
ncbi:MAG: carboxypeptidase-like regulatory domain-containing protein [Bacteroidota bacterium]